MINQDKLAATLNINRNRVSRKWSRGELLGRLAWAMCGPFFAYSPRQCWGWRRFLLRLFGAQVGVHVQIYPSVKIFIPWNLSIGHYSSIGFDALIYNLGPINIRERVTISQRTHLCGGSHDCRDATLPLLKLPITIGNDVWICADAFVGPNVVVGDGAVVGACAAVFKNVESWIIVGGNPAKEIGKRTLGSPHE